MKKRPGLKDLTPEHGEANPPQMLFGSRRRGFFKAKHLCRVWTLEALQWLRIRGEFFVVWNNGGDDYDGRYYLTHAFTIKYLSMNIGRVRHQRGAEVDVKDLHEDYKVYMSYVYSHMCTVICVQLYGCIHMISRMIVHI